MDFSLIPDALYWKYPEATFSFYLATSGEMIFANWVHPSIPEPSRAELEAILKEYLKDGIHQPDWKYFYAHLEGTPIELAILTSPQKLMVNKLSLEFAKREAEYFDLQRLQKYWNGAVVGFNRLNVAQIAELNEWCEVAHLPIRFAQDGAMVIN